MFYLFLIFHSPISPWYRAQVVAAFYQEFSPYPTRKLILVVCIKVQIHTLTRVYYKHTIHYKHSRLETI